MNKAIFFDRDGVLTDNSQHYYIWKTEQLNFVDGVFLNLKKLSAQGFLLFIVSNQGGISRGLYTKDDTLSLHEEMTRTFSKKQIEISETAFCPHHPDYEKCLCRKPSSLMIEKLIAKHDVNKSDSFLIGDSESDMEAATLAGIRGIRIPSNQNMEPFISFLLS